MKETTKEKAFEQFVLGLIKWWAEVNPEKEWEENDLSILKVLKILFFVSAVGADSKGDGLLNIFDNWVAMPYGHVEKDVFDLIRHKKGEFSFFTLTNTRIILK
mgnify:CR=1 FL=1